MSKFDEEELDFTLVTDPKQLRRLEARMCELGFHPTLADEPREPDDNSQPK